MIQKGQYYHLSVLKDGVRSHDQEFGKVDEGVILYKNCIVGSCLCVWRCVCVDFVFNVFSYK